MKICPSGQGLTHGLRLVGQGCPALLTLSLLLTCSSTALNPKRKEAPHGLHERRSVSSLVQRGREKPSEVRRPGLQEGHPMVPSPSKPQGKCWHGLGALPSPASLQRAAQKSDHALWCSTRSTLGLSKPHQPAACRANRGTLLSPTAPPPTGLPGGTEARDLCICKVW